MNNPDRIFEPSLCKTACLIQQNQMLASRTPCCAISWIAWTSVGDRLWRMDRRLTTPPVDQARDAQAAAKKRRLARKQSAARKRSGKQGMTLERWGLQPLSIRMSQGAHTPIH